MGPAYTVTIQGTTYAIRPEMVEQLEEYVKHRRSPCKFLLEILSNNLIGAFTAADQNNLVALPAYANYLYWEIPSLCWGSPAKVNAWLAGKENDDQ